VSLSEREKKERDGESKRKGGGNKFLPGDINSALLFAPAN